MDQEASLELLRLQHEFPGKFLFKAIGKNQDEFPERVVAAVRETLCHDFDSPFELKHTPHGRHVSVSVEPWVDSAEQVIAVYAKVRHLEGLVMMM